VLECAPFSGRLQESKQAHGKHQVGPQARSPGGGKKDDAEKVLRESQRVIDRVVAKGILHRNAGDRHKSRLAHAVKGLK
jgi:ribosomal protein S20